MALTKVRGSGVESIQTLTIADGLTLSDGDVTLASGHGINFSATANSSGTMSSELLDDYEVGTFTPTIQAVTAGPSTSGFVGETTSSYVKTGKTVCCFISIDFNDTGNNLTLDDRWKIGGLPFTPSLSDFYSVGTWWCYGAISSGNNAFGHIGLSNSTNIVHYYCTHVDGTLHYGNPIKAVITYKIS